MRHPISKKEDMLELVEKMLPGNPRSHELMAEARFNEDGDLEHW